MRPVFDESRASDPQYLERYADRLLDWDSDRNLDGPVVLNERQMRHRIAREVYTATGVAEVQQGQWSKPHVNGRKRGAQADA